MRIILTSDLHLKKDHKERFDALVEILKVAKEKKGDRIIIAGDLFDSPHDARRLRPKIRKLLEGNPIPIMVIPGNHDHNCYEENLDFGDNFYPMVEQPLQMVDVENCHFVAVPYFEGRIVDIIAELSKVKRKDLINILIIHGSLDLTGFSRLDFGDEKNYRYLPITEEAIKEIGFNYILAGHYHAESILKKIGRTKFIYPGSPVWITKREQGHRYAYLIDTVREPMPIVLKTHYYQPINITIHPGEEKEKLIELKKTIDEHDRSLAKLEINIKGFIKIAEKDFRALVEKLAGGITVNGEWRQVSDLVSEPFYNRVIEKIRETDLEPDLRRRVEEMFIEAMIQ